MTRSLNTFLWAGALLALPACTEPPAPKASATEAKAAPPAEPAPQAGAPLPGGEYICYIALYEHTYAGRLHILEGGQYRYVTSGEAPAGTYQYEPGANTIRFQGGTLDPALWTGELGRREDNGAPIITLHYKRGTPREVKQDCNFNG